MSWQTDTTGPHAVAHSGHWRRIGVALLVGLALTVAACGSPTGGAGGPPPTPKPTATLPPSPTPLPTSWHTVSSPNVKYSIPSVNELYAESVLTATNAWAVGGTFAGAPGPAASLIERWDGTAWQLVTNPGPGNLYGVVAVSAHDVW
ncbi:MAG TPA: hypothetical protein VF510_26125, partial [Ktedonobacterales bacterium]